MLAFLRTGAKVRIGLFSHAPVSQHPQTWPEKLAGRKWKRLAVGAMLVLGAALPGRPVDVLVVQPRQGTELRLPMPLGHAATTRYLHSVERTPVDDEYYIVGRRVWQWRTLTRSHNAGLPWQAPAQGRFITEGPWLVLEGGRRSWDDLRLRVGDENLGRNELTIGRAEPLALYKRFSGQPLRLSADRMPFLATLLP